MSIIIMISEFRQYDDVIFSWWEANKIKILENSTEVANKIITNKPK